MESFRVRNSAPDQQRNILLPISFGVSSVTLLHVLDSHLKTQKLKTGRTGFALVVLFVDTSALTRIPFNQSILERVRERYPDHVYICVPLENVLCSHLDHALLSGIFPGARMDEKVPLADSLSTLLNSFTSATARADVLPMLRTRLIVQEAKRLACEGVVWGDSTTRLAEKTLAETAKGRGFSLPWQIADGESPFGIACNYPLRDLLRKELVAHVDLVEPSLSPLIQDTTAGPTQASMNSKNTTIDDLMKQYFESVEENFPSIVANVVRTTAKLEAVPSSLLNPRCSLCQMPVADTRFGIHGWGGDQQDGLEPSSIGHYPSLCYGCTRSAPREAS
jgi:cytoplasmic tRNA 2-thiolation protein 2